MSHFRHRTLVVSAVVAGLLALGGALIVLTRTGETRPADMHSSPTVAAAARPLGGLDFENLAAYGLRITPVDSAFAAIFPLKRNAAVTAALQHAPEFSRAVPSDELEALSQGASPGRCSGTGEAERAVQALCWAVALPPQRRVLHGPMRSPGATTVVPDHYVVVVDATTGEFIRSVEWTDPAP